MNFLEADVLPTRAINFELLTLRWPRGISLKKLRIKFCSLSFSDFFHFWIAINSFRPKIANWNKLVSPFINDSPPPNRGLSTSNEKILLQQQYFILSPFFFLPIKSIKKENAWMSSSSIVKYMVNNIKINQNVVINFYIVLKSSAHINSQ